MHIAIGSDHAGYRLKEELAERLRGSGGAHEVHDLGTRSESPVDYPDFAEAVALAVREGTATHGIVICGSGVGASVTANKVTGIRAGLCHDCYSARQGVEHDHMNVLVLGSRVVGVELAWELVSAFIGATPSTNERHLRRLAKLRAVEERR